MGIQIFVESAQPTIIGLLAGFVTVIVRELSQALGVENKNMVKLATILRLSSAQNPDVIWCRSFQLVGLHWRISSTSTQKGPNRNKPCELNSSKEV